MLHLPKVFAMFVVGLCCDFSSGLSISQGQRHQRQHRQEHQQPHPIDGGRRSFLTSGASAAMAATVTFVVAGAPRIANARYVLNEETGEYDEVEDPTWQEAWKGRLEKAQSMSTDDILMAARGAGNVNKSNQDGADATVSLASQKRRAMAACRDSQWSEKAGVRDTKECSARVLNGDIDFILDVMPKL